MHRNLLGSLVATGSIAALCCAAPAYAQLAEEFELSIPAQDLALSLREVSRRTGRNIIAPSELVRGRRSPPVSGPFTAEGAVRVLLAGSGLDVRRVGDSLVIFMPAIESAQQETGAASATVADETIVVTGTHLRGAPPTSPTIVLTRDDIDRTAASSVEQLMRRVPQNFQGGVNQENFGVIGAGADILEHGAGINLRGLGQRATLVLVNGRRLAPSGAGSFVDVSLIPLSAVERVEIVTSGASAIYGSDAVGGVVNFLLRDGFDGLETSLLASATTAGGGAEVVAGVTGGRDWSGGHALLSYEFRDVQPIVAEDRPFTINLPPATSIFPGERRHSVFGAFSQQLDERLTVELQGLWARRDTERTYFVLATPLPIEATATATATNLSARASYALGSNWLVSAGSLYSLSETAQSQRQPGAPVELQNLLDTRHELLEQDLKVDGSLVALPGGPVRLALGGSLRNEHFDDLFAAGVLTPMRRRQERKVRALFAEASVSLFSSLNRRPGLERLVVDGAVRFEDYDAFGSTLNPRIGALWSPFRGLTFRGSYDTSFRAPLLSETGGVYNAFYFPAAIVSVTPATPGEVALVMVGSNPDIRPERSKSWTAGAEFEPDFVPGLRLTANYYSIRFSDRIALPSPTVVVVGNPVFDPIVTRDPSAELAASLVAGAAFLRDVSGPGFSNGGATPADVDLIVDLRFNNTAVTTTSGLDFGLRYAFSIGSNRFLGDANANYIIAFDDQLTRAAPRISALNRPYRPVDLRLRAGLSWTRGPWGAHAAVNHADGYRDDRQAIVRPIGAFTTVDAGLAYETAEEDGLLGGMRLSLTAQNLFATRPPRLVPDPGSTRGLGYDAVNATGRGRVLTLQIRKTW